MIGITCIKEGLIKIHVNLVFHLKMYIYDMSGGFELHVLG